MLDSEGSQGVLAAIAVDPELTLAQKQSLSQIYETFRNENIRSAPADEAPSETAPSETAPSEAAPSETAPSEAAQPDVARPEADVAQSIPIPEETK